MATLSDTVDEVVAAHPFAIVMRGHREALVAAPWSRSAPWLQAARLRSEDEIGRWVALQDLGNVLPDIRRMVDAEPSWSDQDVVQLFIRQAVAGRICAATARERREFRMPPLLGGFPTRFQPAEVAAAVNSAELPTKIQADFWKPLIEVWLDDYAEMPGSTSDTLEFSDHGYRFLFDVGASRTVVAFGTAGKKSGKRDSSRMAGFLGKDPSDVASESWRDRFFRLYEGKYDRGHFMSHGQGGGLDANLFPQRSDVNQGHSEAGKSYRSMEKFAADNAGTLCFSRPVYSEDSWVPLVLDYGLIPKHGQLRAERFQNRY
ncbi:hypothetical protein [Enterovirga sp. CN4-39]|uniref:hypothetical protein n=1 Tax=Enterovirga sp. CN4-39 TaxID=3400910 RepID=UPI003C008F94